MITQKKEQQCQCAGTRMFKTNYRQNKNKKFVHIWDIYEWEISFAGEDW